VEQVTVMTSAEQSAVKRQADRYLMASQQDTDSLYGLTHASYALILYEMLTIDGVDVRARLKLAAGWQDKWGMKIRAVTGGTPFPPNGQGHLPMGGYCCTRARG